MFKRREPVASGSRAPHRGAASIATPSGPPSVRPSQATRRTTTGRTGSRKGKERAVEQEHEPTLTTSVAPPKSAVKALTVGGKNQKKRVRINLTSTTAAAGAAGAAASTSSSSDDETSNRSAPEGDDAYDASEDEIPPPRASHSGSKAVVEGEEAGTWDWTDTTMLPLPGAVQRKREMKSLDQAALNSALYDVATDRMDLGRTLLEWEALKRRRRVEEEAGKGNEEQEEQEEGDVEGRRSPAHGTANRLDELRSRPTSPMTSDIETEAQASRARVPMPSALQLEQMSRWPLHPSVLPHRHDQVSLSEALEQLVARRLQSLGDSASFQCSPPVPNSPRRTARSAYGANAPLSAYTDSNLSASLRNFQQITEDDDDPTRQDDTTSSDDEDDLDSTLDDPIDSLDRAPELHALLDQLHASVNTLTNGLLQRVPLGPPPPIDYWQKTGALAPVDLPRAIGWESVVEVAKGMDGISESVAQELERRMTAFYGPTRPAHPIDLVSSGPPLAPRVKKPRSQSRRAKSEPPNRSSPPRESDDEDDLMGRRKRGREEDGGTPTRTVKRTRRIEAFAARSLPASRSGSRQSTVSSDDTDEGDDQIRGGSRSSSIDAPSPVERLIRLTKNTELTGRGRRVEET